MTLNYLTTSKDYLHLLNRILTGSVLGKKFSRFAWVALSALAWTGVILPYLKFEEFGLGFWLRAIFAVVVTIGWPYFYDKYTDGVFNGIVNDKTLARFAGETSITISQEFIEATTQSTISKAKWEDLYFVEINKTHIFIFFTPIIATPVSMNAFKDSIEKNEFIRIIESHVRLAGKK
jgi:hypothetical protein